MTSAERGFRLRQLEEVAARFDLAVHRSRYAVAAWACLMSGLEKGESASEAAPEAD